MTSGLSLVALAVVAATASCMLIIREIHIRTLDARVSNAVMGVSGRSAPFQDVTGWFSSLGMRYRRFYAEENLDQLRTILQSSGFNHHRALPTWIGIKAVSMALCPIIAGGRSASREAAAGCAGLHTYWRGYRDFGAAIDTGGDEAAV